MCTGANIYVCIRIMLNIYIRAHDDMQIFIYVYMGSGVLHI